MLKMQTPPGGWRPEDAVPGGHTDKIVKALKARGWTDDQIIPVINGQATPPHTATEAEALKAIEYLRPFMSRGQRRTVQLLMQGEEAQFFYDKMFELADRVANMPKTYEQDGLGDQAIVHLHYFAGGRANWYITEKDMGNGPGDTRQIQAFGLADLFGNGGELGFISIEEILSCNGELDFHFTPKPLAAVRH